MEQKTQQQAIWSLLFFLKKTNLFINLLHKAAKPLFETTFSRFGHVSPLALLHKEWFNRMECFSLNVFGEGF